MPQQKDTIFIYTVNFPYGNSEPYLHNELPYLSKHFKKVIIIPILEEKGNVTLPTNVEVKFLSEIKNYNTRRFLFIKNFWVIQKILFNEFINCNAKLFYLKRIRYYLSELLNAIELSEKITQIDLHEKSSTLHYSFWMNSWALALSFLKQTNKINTFVFRLHGFDLYKERWPKHFIPFRQTCYKYSNAIFPISKLGKRYIKENFTFSNKAKVFYLGTIDQGMNRFSDTEFHIVSCSNFVPLKRLNLIAEALTTATTNLKWTHIGAYTSNELEKLKPILDRIPNNVNVIIKGHLSQNDLQNFYKTEPVSMFLNVSESEGIPVSIMEAISFGIPILATNVGAMHEIVTEKTGILLNKNITPAELLNEILKFKDSKFNCSEVRNDIKQFWRDSFSAQRNFDKFCEYLSLMDNLSEDKLKVWNEKYKEKCTKCVLDTTDDPQLILNEQGVCNYCLTYEKDFEGYLGMSLSVKNQQLIKLAEKIKSDTNGKNYNCLIGVSGGVDSSFVAIKAYELGLKALLIHFDNGWNSELAVKNIEQIAKYTGFDLFTYVVDWEEFKDLQKAYIKSGVLDWEVPTDHGLWAITLKKAKELNVKYVLTGFNYQTEGTLPKPMRYDKGDLKNIKDIYKHFGSKRKFKSFPTYNFWQHQYLKLIWGLKIEPILCLLDYNKSISKSYLIDKIGWRDYGGKHYESIFTRFYQGYALKEKFGVDKRKAHLASMICSGQITREEALMELENPIIDPEVLKEDLRFFLKKMDFSEEEFNKIMLSKPVPHENYKSYSSFDYPLFKFILPKLVAIKNIFKFSKA
jgi:N-acetyl sugar amidotransferase